MDKLAIGITLGDPAGIGPEIIVRALGHEEATRSVRPLVYGDARVVEAALPIVGSKLRVRRFQSARSAATEAQEPGVVDVIDIGNIDTNSLRRGEVQAMCGRAAFQYIEAAVADAMAGVIAAVDTAPINKESIRAAGVPFIGHTEMLAELAHVADPLTMFETLGLRVFFLTRHVSLRAACDLVTKKRLVDYIARCSRALDGLLGGAATGALAIAGLNPHCGEHGLFGDEEGREVEPAIAEAKAAGFRVEGPIGADSVFHQAKIGKYAAVLSLYHDQGHIACKTLDFDRTVSLTLGLPFLRTSVDHGTAFDIAGTGRASEVSMLESILAAARYAAVYRQGSTSRPTS